MEYFHVTNDLLESGFKLSPQYGKKIVDPRFYISSDHNHAHYLREMIIEDFRAVHFSDKPSRLNSVYLFDDIRLALKFKKEHRKEFIYSVEVNKDSEVHKADMNLMDLTVRRSIDEIHRIANCFYSGEITDNPHYEILCDSDVKVNRKIEVHQEN